jgi:hypothetical protein
MDARTVRREIGGGDGDGGGMRGRGDGAKREWAESK